MRERSRELRDRIVWVLARLSLTVLLSLMGALFVGSAAQAQGLTTTADVAARDGLAQANPLVLALIGLVVAAGLGVLAVGAFRPQRRRSSRELADLLRD